MKMGLMHLKYDKETYELHVTVIQEHEAEVAVHLGMIFTNRFDYGRKEYKKSFEISSNLTISDVVTFTIIPVGDFEFKEYIKTYHQVENLQRKPSLN